MAAYDADGASLPANAGAPPAQNQLAGPPGPDSAVLDRPDPDRLVRDGAVLGRTLVPAQRAASAIDDRPQAFFQALLTEHFVLQSVRGVTVSEASNRASLYFVTLSSSLVAFGFLARTAYADEYLGVAIPVVVLLGFFSYVRLVQTALEDVTALDAMQRIRRFYATLLPGAGEYFPAPPPEAAANDLLDTGRRTSWTGVFFTTSSAIAVVNSIVAASGIALLLTLTGRTRPTVVVIATVCAAVLILVHGLHQEYRYTTRVRTGEDSAPPMTRPSAHGGDGTTAAAAAPSPQGGEDAHPTAATPVVRSPTRPPDTPATVAPANDGPANDGPAPEIPPTAREENR